MREVGQIKTGERGIGYDENIAQYILLGDGYLMNLNPDGTYAGEQRIIQGLVNYNNIKLNDKAIAIDYERQRLLMVFDYTYASNGTMVSSPLSIVIINFDGSLFTDITEFPGVNAADIKVAFDNVNNRYLLVWSEPTDAENVRSLHYRVISGGSNLPSNPYQSQGQGSGTNNQGTSTAPGLQTAPGIQKK